MAPHSSDDVPLHDDSPIADPALRVLLAMARVGQALRRGISPNSPLKEFVVSNDLTLRYVLGAALLAVDGPMNVSAFAKKMSIALPTASVMINQLVDGGLVDRREDSHDRRRTLVCAAPAVEEVLRETVASRLKPLREALAHVGESDAANLEVALAQIGDIIKRVDQDSLHKESLRLPN